MWFSCLHYYFLSDITGSSSHKRNNTWVCTVNNNGSAEKMQIARNEKKQWRFREENILKPGSGKMTTGNNAERGCDKLESAELYGAIIIIIIIIVIMAEQTEKRANNGRNRKHENQRICLQCATRHCTIQYTSLTRCTSLTQCISLTRCTSLTRYTFLSNTMTISSFRQSPLHLPVMSSLCTQWLFFDIFTPFPLPSSFSPVLAGEEMKYYRWKNRHSVGDIQFQWCGSPR